MRRCVNVGIRCAGFLVGVGVLVGVLVGVVVVDGEFLLDVGPQGVTVLSVSECDDFESAITPKVEK